MGLVSIGMIGFGAGGKLTLVPAELVHFDTHSLRKSRLGRLTVSIYD